MNNIYVDESKIKLYVSKEAPISQDCLYADETKLVSWFEETECELENEDCQLLLLEDRLAEERKIVCNQAKVDIRSLFNSYASSLIDYCIWNKNADSNQKLYNNFKRIINDRLVKVLDLFDKRIDQIERGE